MLIAFFAFSPCPQSALTVISEGLLLAAVWDRDMTLQRCFCRACCCSLMLCFRGVQGDVAIPLLCSGEGWMTLWVQEQLGLVGKDWL